MKYKNEKMIPTDILRAIQSTWTHSKGDSDYSVTELLQPPKVRSLSIIHSDKITSDYSDSINTFIGSSVHRIIELANEKRDNCITEQRVSITIEKAFKDKDIKISGTADYYDKDKNILKDYKTATAFSVGYEKEEHESQLNMYRYMFHKSMGIDLPDAEVVYILKDWSKNKSVNSNTYPNSPIIIKAVKSWSEKEILDFILEKINLHESTLEDPQSVLCTDEERWVSKKGIPNRCLNYCSGSEFCNQYQEEVNNHD